MHTKHFGILPSTVTDISWRHFYFLFCKQSPSKNEDPKPLRKLQSFFWITESFSWLFLAQISEKLHIKRTPMS